MSILPGRPNTALIVIDVQNGVMQTVANRDAVVANINTLVDKARAAGVPVVWVHDSGEDRTPGSEKWKLVPELNFRDSEPVVDKKYGDSFDETDLEKLLADLGVGSLVVAGAQTDACIRSTLHGAFVRGYDVTLVGDAHGTEDLTAYGAPDPDKVIAHTNLYWKYHQGPGRKADTLDTAEVTF
jgi:nicotinamidase-related amidase